MFKLVNGIKVNLTESEIAKFNAEKTAWENASADRKLAEIKQIRLQKLIETDYLANTDVVMADNVKTMETIFTKQFHKILARKNNTIYSWLVMKKQEN